MLLCRMSKLTPSSTYLPARAPDEESSHYAALFLPLYRVLPADQRRGSVRRIRQYQVHKKRLDQQESHSAEWKGCCIFRSAEKGFGFSGYQEQRDISRLQEGQIAESDSRGVQTIALF